VRDIERVEAGCPPLKPGAVSTPETDMVETHAVLTEVAVESGRGVSRKRGLEPLACSSRVGKA
jgi:hypothetical protein